MLDLLGQLWSRISSLAVAVTPSVHSYINPDYILNIKQWCNFDLICWLIPLRVFATPIWTVPPPRLHVFFLIHSPEDKTQFWITWPFWPDWQSVWPEGLKHCPLFNFRCWKRNFAYWQKCKGISWPDWLKLFSGISCRHQCIERAFQSLIYANVIFLICLHSRKCAFTA